MKTAGERFKEWMDKEDLSQSKLASELNITQGYVSKWYGSGIIRTQHLIKIAEKYSTFNVEYYVTGRGNVVYQKGVVEEIEAIYTKDNINSCKDCIHYIANKHLEKENQDLHGQVSFLQNVINNLTINHIQEGEK